MDSLKSVGAFVENQAQNTLKNPYIMAVVKISLVLYAAQIAPKPPQYLSKLFNNTFFKILAIMMIIYLIERDVQLAVMLSIVFVLGMNLLAGRPAIESFAPFSDDFKPYGDAKLIEPKSALYPGCQEIKIDDLLKLFEGDNFKMQKYVVGTYKDLISQVKGKNEKERLMNIAYAIGLPYNVKLNDESAPYIATLFMYIGMDVSGSCAGPK